MSACSEGRQMPFCADTQVIVQQESRGKKLSPPMKILPVISVN